MFDEILNVLNNLAQKFGIVIDWTSDNVIPYLQNLLDRYISYDIYNNIIIIFIISILTIILSVISYVWIKKSSKECKKEFFEQEVIIYCITAIFIAMLIVIIVLDLFIIPLSIDNLIKDIYVPELRILNLLKDI